MSSQFTIVCFSIIQTERAGTLERAEDLQKQLNELHKDHETLRKVLQEKVCHHGCVIGKLCKCDKSDCYSMYMCCAMQKTLIDEMVHHKHKKEEQFEVVRQSLKAKEKEYFALEVDSWLISCHAGLFNAVHIIPLLCSMPVQDAQLNLLQRTEELEV